MGMWEGRLSPTWSSSFTTHRLPCPPLLSSRKRTDKITFTAFLQLYTHALPSFPFQEKTYMGLSKVSHHLWFGSHLLLKTV